LTNGDEFPFCSNLQKVVNRTIADNLTSFIVQSSVDYGGLSEIDIANKLVCFGTNEVTIFHGVKNGITV
jgi:hypothetical protein